MKLVDTSIIREIEDAAPVTITHLYGDDIVRALDLNNDERYAKLAEHLVENQLVDDVLDEAAYTLTNDDDFWELIGEHITSAIISQIGMDKFKELEEA